MRPGNLYFHAGGYTLVGETQDAIALQSEGTPKQYRNIELTPSE